MSRTTNMQRLCLGQFVLLAMASIYATSSPVSVTAFSSPQLPTTKSRVGSLENSMVVQMSMSNNHDNNKNDDFEFSSKNQHQNSRPRGRKRAIVKKYGQAIAISTSLLYGPMASTPFLRRSFGGSTAHAASTLAPSNSAYDFQDFKDVKKKLSLAPGANVEKYNDILSKVEVEGEKALKELKKSESETALIIGGSGSSASGEGSANVETGKSKKRGGKKAQKKQEVSDWESDEFGFGDEEDDDDDGLVSFGSSGTSSAGLGPSKKRGSSASSSAGSEEGGVVMTEKMAFNKYKAPDTKEDRMKKIKVGAFYSIFPVFVITTVRGTVRSYREKKWVKKGLAIVEEEKKKYLEEKKKGKGRNNDDDDDDDDDE